MNPPRDEVVLLRVLVRPSAPAPRRTALLLMPDGRVVEVEVPYEAQPRTWAAGLRGL